MLVRKLVTAALFVVVGTFTLAIPAYAAPAGSHRVAYTAPQGQVQPNFSATGGGCNSAVAVMSTGNTAKITGCISGSGGFLGWQVNPDGYATFSTQSPSLWSSCTVTLKLTDITNNAVRETLSQDCLSEARANASDVHYTMGSYNQGICPLRFRTNARLQGTYNGIPVDINADSNDEFINC